MAALLRPSTALPVPSSTRRREAHLARRAALAARRAARSRRRWQVGLALLGVLVGATLLANVVGLSNFEAVRHWAWLDGPIGPPTQMAALPATGPMPVGARPADTGTRGNTAAASVSASAGNPPSSPVAGDAVQASAAPLPQSDQPGDRPGEAAGQMAGTLRNDGRITPADRQTAGAVGGAAQRTTAVTERDMGLGFMPGSQLLPQESSRVQDPESGSTTMVALVTQEPMDKVLAYYRAQLGKASGGGRQPEEVRPGPGQVLMSVVDPGTGAHQAVWVGQEGGQVLVRMVRAVPGGVPANGATAPASSP